MKRAFCSFLILVFLFGAIGCSKSNPPSVNNTTSEPTVSTNDTSSNTTSKNQQNASVSDNNRNTQNNSTSNEQTSSDANKKNIVKSDKELAEELAKDLAVFIVKKWAPENMTDSEIQKYFTDTPSKVKEGPNFSMIFPYDRKLGYTLQKVNGVSVSASKQVDSNTFAVQTYVTYNEKDSEGTVHTVGCEQTFPIKKVNGEMKCYVHTVMSWSNQIDYRP